MNNNKIQMKDKKNYQEEKAELGENRINQEFINVIKKEMKSKNIKQCELAELIGLNKSAITKFFKNTEYLNIKTLAKIEAALNIEFKVYFQPKII